MGFDDGKKNEHGPLRWASFNAKTGVIKDEETGSEHRSLSGVLIDANYRYTPPRDKYQEKEEAHFVLEDEQLGEKFCLKVNMNTKPFRELMNSLSGISMPGGMLIKFSAWKSEWGGKIAVYDSSEMIKWSHKWNDGKFEGEPDPIDTGKINEETLKPEKDYRPVSMYWKRKFFEFAAKVKGVDYEIPRNQEKAEQEALKSVNALQDAKIFERLFEKKKASLEATYLHPADTALIMDALIQRYKALGGKDSKILNYSAKEQEVTADEDFIEDLPF